MKNLIKAFTLIELLIVIVIIGILAVAMIPRIIGVQDKARYVKVEKDFQNFRAAVFLAQSNTNKALAQISGETCSGCRGCLTDTNPNPSQCKARRQLSLRNIESAAGLESGALSTMNTDPRGSPYILDENELSFPSFDCSVLDNLSSAGPNKSFTMQDLLDSAYVYTGTALRKRNDNIGIGINPATCPGGY